MERTWFAAAVFLAMAGCMTAATVDAVAPADGAGTDVADATSSEACDAALDDSSSEDAAPLGLPAEHRAVATACASTADGGQADLSPMNQRFYGTAFITCHENADCTAQPNGHCAADMRGPGDQWGTACVYDECLADEDCPSNHVCACGISSGGHYEVGPNRCVPATCQTDDDCGEAGACSPSANPSCRPLVDQYACRTAADECSNDADCELGDSCYFSGSRWTCGAPGGDCSP